MDRGWWSQSWHSLSLFLLVFWDYLPLPDRRGNRAGFILSCFFSDCGSDTQGGGSRLGQGVKDKRLEILLVTVPLSQLSTSRQSPREKEAFLCLQGRSLVPCSWVFCFLIEQCCFVFISSWGCICHLYACRHCPVPGALPLLWNDCQVTEECTLSHCIRLLVAGDSKSLRKQRAFPNSSN